MRKIKNELENIPNIQIQLLNLLKIKIDKYNSFESSSISMDKAKVIMESNLYTIGLYLKKFNQNEAEEQLNNNSIIDLYEKGRKQLTRKISVSKVLYQKVLNNLLKTKNETYNSTIIDGIKAFFKIYDPDYDAKNIKITADYPLYNNVIGKYEGIEFIEKYLEMLYYENEFCRLFSNESIEQLLYSYSKRYENLIINIFKIILTQAIGCILANKNYLNLSISKDQIQNIYEMFEGKNKDQIFNLIFEAYTKINIEKEKIKQYIEVGIREIQAEIYNSFKLNNLDKVFFSISLFYDA